MTRHSDRPRLLTRPTPDIGALTGVLHPGGEPQLDTTNAAPSGHAGPAIETVEAHAEAWHWR